MTADGGTHPRTRDRVPAARRRRRAGRLVGGREQHPRRDPRRSCRPTATSGCACPTSAPDCGATCSSRTPSRRATSSRSRIVRALAAWEPRIAVEAVDVEADPDDPEAAIATIRYTLVATQAPAALDPRGDRSPDEHRAPRTRAGRRAPTRSLLDEALARIPIHNPEWTNFNRSDPGVTLHRAVRVPHREPAVPRQPDPRAQPARVPVAARRAAAAGDVGARPRPDVATTAGRRERSTLERRPRAARRRRCRSAREMGLDVLPVEAVAYFKRPLDGDPAGAARPLRRAVRVVHRRAARPRRASSSTRPCAVDAARQHGRRSARRPRDRSLWIALLLRKADGVGDAALAGARAALAGKTLSLGVVPVLDDPEAVLSPLGRSVARGACAGWTISCRRSRPPARSTVRRDASRTTARSTRGATANVLDEPGIVQLTLPGEDGLTLWQDLDPLEDGTGELPAGARGHEARRPGRHLAAGARLQRRPGPRCCGPGSTRSPSASRRASPARSCPTAPAARPGRPARADAGPSRDASRVRVGRRRRGRASTTSTPRRPRCRSPTCGCAPGVRPPAARDPRRLHDRRRPPASCASATGCTARGRLPVRSSAPTTPTAAARAGNVEAGAITTARVAARGREGHQPGAYLGRRGGRDGRRGREADRRATCATATGSCQRRGLRGDRPPHAGRRHRPRRRHRRPTAPSWRRARPAMRPAP